MIFLIVLLAYLVGSIPFGYVVVKLRDGFDVRSVGSGNIGATNVLRAVGKGGAFVTLLLDAAKGYAAVLISGTVSHGKAWIVALSAVAVILGHMFPIFLRFRGGKGVATGVGTFLYLAKLPVLLAILIFLLTIFLWRYVSLASLLGAAFFPILYYLLEYPQSSSLSILLAASFCSLMIIVRHRTNIQRLVAGKEPKLTRSK